MNLQAAVKWIWIVFWSFWVLAAFVRRRSVRRQSAGSRLFQMTIVFVALSPFFLADRKFGILEKSFVPRTPEIQFLGVLLLVAGCGFAIWARFILGRNWSGSVTVKENHTLITAGPYAWVRHPIYSGILLAVTGTALVIGKFAVLLAVAVSLLALWLKLRTEEQFMMETFGDRYAAYKLRVKALIPHVL